MAFEQAHKTAWNARHSMALDLAYARPFMLDVIGQKEIWSNIMPPGNEGE